MDADNVHCFSPHNEFMHNYAGQQTSRYHTDHTHESHFVGLFCDAGYFYSFFFRETQSVSRSLVVEFLIS